MPLVLLVLALLLLTVWVRTDPGTAGWQHEGGGFNTCCAGGVWCQAAHAAHAAQAAHGPGSVPIQRHCGLQYPVTYELAVLAEH
mgnify:CR=1 FL=1